MDDVDRIFYLIPRRQRSGESVDLFLPKDLLAEYDGEVMPSMGFGIFTFLRTPLNRGKQRLLSFPGVVGFGQNSRNMNLVLQSEFISNRTRRADRFSFVQSDVTLQLGINATFVARKFGPQFSLAGDALKLPNYSLWALIPEDREHLERLWVEHGFYLMGHGSLREQDDVSNE